MSRKGTSTALVPYSGARNREKYELEVDKVLARTSRRDFVPSRYKDLADLIDLPVPVRDGVTVPSREMTKLVVSLLELTPSSRVLEIGTGSGYQASVMAQLCAEVVSVDIDVVGDDVLDLLPANVVLHDETDGRYGVPSEGEFDAILVTCGCYRVEHPWVCHLMEGGRMVVPLTSEPVGHGHHLVKYIKRDGVLDDMGDYAYAQFVPIRR